MTTIFVSSSFLLICIVNLSYGDRIPSRYTINLDIAPENRWDKIIDEHRSFFRHHYVPKFLRPIIWWIDEKILFREFPEEYAQEMRGIAERSGLRIGEVIGMNILYDISAFDRKHITTNVGCTSIVAEDYNGRIIHGRNLDFNMASLLQNLTIIADFTRDGNILYTAVTFVLHVGLCTGQKHGAFSISLNERYSGAYIDTILMEFYTQFKRPVTFTIRMALEEKDTFEEARDLLMKEHFVAPSYLIIAGTKSGQACIITRNRWKTADLECTDPDKDQWFLVVTNFDHWKVDKDKRRKTAEKALRWIGRNAITYETMLQILSIHPVENNLTIFSTVMSPLNQHAIYDYTFVREQSITGKTSSI
ncbi:N-acylethanolamine-hydrolyzing acid amidase [Dirofilaria immitis]|nr:N-acylethanolamine-hydrolyzing acid amidase [Dirofilaria immitis]